MFLDQYLKHNTSLESEAKKRMEYADVNIHVNIASEHLIIFVECGMAYR